MFAATWVIAAVITLEIDMSFSLKILFVATFLVALLCVSFGFAPTATLSVILLGFLPLLVFTACKMRSRTIRILTCFVLGPVACYAFFVGAMLGPWAAIAAAPQELGFANFRSTVMIDYLNWTYTHAVAEPWIVLDPKFESPLSLTVFERLKNYQRDWMHLVGAELK